MEETDFLLESEMTDKKDILLCSCYSTEHQMLFYIAMMLLTEME